MFFSKDLVKPFVPIRAIQAIVTLAAAHPRSRKVLNALYGKLSMRQRNRFHDHFAKLFRSRDNSSVGPGEWNVNFAGTKIKLPLTPKRFWLDWDTALSIDGHDTEIKKTYWSLLTGSERPVTFIDVGANYGTHSLIFLAHGVDVLTIEPNPLCHGYFFEICKLNGVTPRLENVAVGNSDQPLKLSFPESETWLGSVEPVTVEELQSMREPLSNMIVQQRRIDDFLPSLKPGRMLIKIDAEGFETEVISGAIKTLQAGNPKIIFEAMHTRRRQELFDLFNLLGYGVASLPWKGVSPPLPLAKPAFLSHPLANFLAFPIDATRN
jgi:FkbM family methyltransferase